jgi:hypothetical protein
LNQFQSEKKNTEQERILYLARLRGPLRGARRLGAIPPGFASVKGKANPGNASAFARPPPRALGSWIVFKRWQNLLIEPIRAPAQCLVLMAVALLGVASLRRVAASDPEPPFEATTVRALTAIAETGRMASMTPGIVVASGCRCPLVWRG